MIQILGAILTAGVCAWMGDRRAGQLKKRVDTLSSLIAALRGMERELSACLTPLPGVMERLESWTKPPVQSVFEQMKQALGQLEEEGVCAAWEKAIRALPNLEGEDRSIVCSLGVILGRYDGHRQGEAVDRACQELERNRLQAEENFQRLGRVYRTLGAVCGGFLLILLL